jgi:hypothetical protein
MPTIPFTYVLTHRPANKDRLCMRVWGYCPAGGEPHFGRLFLAYHGPALLKPKSLKSFCKGRPFNGPLHPQTKRATARPLCCYRRTGRVGGQPHSREMDSMDQGFIIPLTSQTRRTWCVVHDRLLLGDTTRRALVLLLVRMSAFRLVLHALSHAALRWSPYCLAIWMPRTFAQACDCSMAIRGMSPHCVVA